MIRFFVNGEPWQVGGDLEEHPTGLAEVDRAEVVAVEDGGDVETAGRDLLPPFPLRRLIRRPPGDVVHRSDRRQPSGPVRLLKNVRKAPAGARAEVSRPPIRLFDLLKAQEGSEEIPGSLPRLF